MKPLRSRRLGFFTSIIAIATALAFGCSDGGGGGKNTPPDGPASTLDKMVLSFATPVTVNVETSKALSESYLSDSTYFATSLTNDKFVQITPDVADIYNYSMGFAPNGDFWFVNGMGIFIANVNSSEQKARMLISSEQLTKNFVDSSTEGIYKIYNRPSQISFVTTDQDKGSYVGAFSYIISVDTNKEQGMNYYQISLRYDSEKGEFTQILKQFSTPAKTASELYYVRFYNNHDAFYDNALSTDQSYFHFILTDQSYSGQYILNLSSDAEKLYFISPYYDDTHRSFSDIDGNIYFTNNYTELAGLSCEQTNCPPYPDNQSAMTLIANCVNNAIKDSYVPIYKLDKGGVDVTSSASDASSLITKIKALAASPKLVEAFKVKASYFDNVTYSDQRMYYENSRCYFNNDAYLDIEAARASTNYTFDAGKLNLDIAKDGYFFITDRVDGAMEIYYRNLGDDTPTKIFNFGADSSVVGSKASYSSSLGDILLFDLRTYGYDSEGYTDYNQYTDQIYIYSAAKGGYAEITGPSSMTYLAGFVEVKQNVYDYDYGFTRDGEYLLYKTVNNDETAYYFLKTADIFPTAEDQTPASPILAVEGIQNAKLLFVWKDAALWSLGNAVYMNYPFSSDRKAVKLNEVEGKECTDFSISTVVEATLPEDLGLDISSDFKAAYKCGAEGKFATYCPGANEMCVNKACKSMTVSECTKNEDCKDTNYCSNGLCKYVKCYSHSDCPVGSNCPYATYCKSLGHSDECYDDYQCYVYSSTASSSSTKSAKASAGKNTSVTYDGCYLDQTVGYMRCLSTCSSNEDCTDGKVCTDYFCIEGTPTEEFALKECDNQTPCDSNYVCVKDFKTSNTNIFNGQCSTESCNLCIPTTTGFELAETPSIVIGADTISLTGKMNILAPNCLSKYAFCSLGDNVINVQMSVKATYNDGYKEYATGGMRIIDAVNSPTAVSFRIDDIPANSASIDLYGKVGLAEYAYGSDFAGEYTRLISNTISNPHCMANGDTCPTNYICRDQTCVVKCTSSSQCTNMPCVNNQCLSDKPILGSPQISKTIEVLVDKYEITLPYGYPGIAICKLYSSKCSSITESSTFYSDYLTDSQPCILKYEKLWGINKDICLMVIPVAPGGSTNYWELKAQKDINL